jgi:hypothetical protein
MITKFKLFESDIEEDYNLTEDNAWKFEYDLVTSIGLRGTQSYGFKNGAIIRIKDHTPNWSNFSEDLYDNPNINRVINVTVGDYNNSDYRKNKTDLEQIEKEFPEVEFIDITIEDGESINDNIEYINRIINRKNETSPFDVNENVLFESKSDSIDNKIKQLLNGKQDLIKIDYEYAHAELSLEQLSDGEMSIYISEIWADIKGKGYATNLLKIIKNYSDNSDIPISLRASILNNIKTDPGLNQKDLVNWYIKNGFEISEEYNNFDTDPDTPFMLYNY